MIPRIEELKPDVLIVTGDHSTPSKLKSHSWHPVPTLLVADPCRPDGAAAFGERNCLSGGLGQFSCQASHASGHGSRRSFRQIRRLIL